MKREISRLWSLVVILECIILVQIVAATHSWAGGFQYPVDADHIIRYERTANDGEWYDYQPFGSIFNLPGKVHLGADLNRMGGDAGEPVYAVNDCIVFSWDDTDQATDWGKWIILRCDAPSGTAFTLTDGSAVSRVYVFYAHLGEIRIYTDTGSQYGASGLSSGFAVRRGWRIGTVGNANGTYGNAYHLHFEVRPHGLDRVGTGYLSYDNWSYTETNTDPIEFIENNFVQDCRNPRLIIHPYDLEDRGTVFLAIDHTLWKRVGRESSYGASVGYGNYVWTVDSDKGTNASWTFTARQTGWYDVYVYLPRLVASATQVTYRLWHDGEGNPNPYVFVLNQADKSSNEKKFIGRFKFSANGKYTLDIFGRSGDRESRVIVIDAVELALSGIPNAGGATVSIDDHDLDMMDDAWERSVGLNPEDPGDANLDQDGDGLTALQEYRLGTDPRKANSDGDAFSDGEEYRSGTDPLDTKSCPTCSPQKNNGVRDLRQYADPQTKDAGAVSRNVHLMGENTVGGCSSGGDADELALIIPFVSLIPRRKRHK